MAELKPCPFCGGKAEIYTGRTFPAQGKALCESRAEALEELEEYRKNGVVLRSDVGERKMKRANMKESKTKWCVVVVMQAFIPRCCSKSCIGRTQTMFRTAEEAIETWNRRSEDVRV